MPKFKSESFKGVASASKVTIIYLCFSLLWIVLSDKLLLKFVSDPWLYSQAQTYKGVGFVVVTATIIYFQVRRVIKMEIKMIRSLDQQNHQLVDLTKELRLEVDRAEASSRLITQQSRMIDEMLKEINAPMVLWKSDGLVSRTNFEMRKLLKASVGLEDLSDWSELQIENMPVRLKQLQTMSEMNGFETWIGERLISWSDKCYALEGQSPFILSLGRDITREREEEENIRRLVEYDSLTGLYSRNRFDLDIKRFIAKGQSFELLYIDVDDFKDLNDLYGFGKGDQILVRLARYLKEIFCEASIYRWSGDEFIVVCHVNRRSVLETKISELYDKFKKKWSVGEFDAYIGISIGLVNYPLDGIGEEELLRNADLALHQAKKEGKSTSVAYEPAMLREMEQRLEVHRRLDEAIVTDQLTLMFQPIYNLFNRKTVSVEVLLRWDAGKGMKISTQDMVAIAEESEQIIRLDKWVISQVLKMLQEDEAVFSNLNVSINLSTRTFKSPDFLDFLALRLQESGVAPSQIQFEITEHSILEDLDKSLERMIALKKTGVRMAMDDFGTKYSSLNYLAKLPFDALKIDKSYTDKITSDRATYKIVQTIIKLSHDLGLKTVAEGIETVEQENLMYLSGCDVAQGYHYSMPLSIEDLKLHLEENI